MSKRGENIYKRKDGRYEGRYVIGRSNGKTRFGYIYGRCYTDVRRRLNAKKAEFQSKKAGSSQSFGSWMTDWMECEIRSGVRLSSYQTYRNLLKNHLLPSLGGMRISDITPSVVRDFLQTLYRKQLSDSMIRSIYRLLSAGMRSALDEGLICRNPCGKLQISRDQKYEQRALSLEEQQMICSAAKKDANISALLSLYTGMRLGEICALKWEDINWKDHSISVSRTAQRIQHGHPQERQKTVLMIGQPKSYRSRRVLPLADFLLQMLRQYQAETGADSGYIFGTDSRPAEPRTIQRRFRKMVSNLGIENVHFHSLRHSFATRLMELSIDVKTVSALLGHESVKTTLDFYVHSVPESQRLAAERLATYAAG